LSHITSSSPSLSPSLTHTHIHVHTILHSYMGWLRLVGSLKIYVSFAEYRLFYKALLQKRPIIQRSLLIVATPYTVDKTKFKPGGCLTPHPHLSLSHFLSHTHRARTQTHTFSCTGWQRPIGCPSL